MPESQLEARIYRMAEGYRVELVWRDPQGGATVRDFDSARTMWGARRAARHMLGKRTRVSAGPLEILTNDDF